MERHQVGQIVLLSGVGALVFAVVTFAIVPALRSQEAPQPGATQPRREAPVEVTLWRGEIAEGVTAVLTSVFGDPRPDEAHDADLNAKLGLAGSEQLGFHRLLLFNASETPFRFQIEEGAIVILGAEGQPRILLHDLAERVASGGLAVEPALAFALRGLGALRDEVLLDPGTMANLVVPFSGRIALADATAVEMADGTAFERRPPVSRVALRRLIERPRLDDLRNL